jgi:hypothetical protein
MTIRSRYVLAVSAAVVAVVLGMRACDARRVAEWRHRVGVETARADSLLSLAEQEYQRAEEGAIQAERLALHAARNDTIVRERVRVVRDTVVIPDTCFVYVAQRDSLIDDLLGITDTLTLAFAEQKRAYVVLQGAYRSTQTAADSLRNVLEDYPSPLPWFVPSLEAGVFAGICLDGQPCTGVGVGLTWKLPLFGGR